MKEITIQTISIVILFLYPTWRIYDRVGLDKKFLLTLLIPYIGFFVCAAILAYSKWEIKNNKEGSF